MRTRLVSGLQLLIGVMYSIAVLSALNKADFNRDLNVNSINRLNNGINKAKPKCKVPNKDKKPKPDEPVNKISDKLYGIGYNAKHSTGECSNLQKVLTDFYFLKNYTDRIRTFGLIDCYQGPLLLEAAHKANIKLSLGIFINQFEFEFNREFSLLKSMITQNKTVFENNVEYIIVGSESFYRKETTLEQLANYVNLVKDFLRSQKLDKFVKVTCADIKDSWYPSKLTDSVDVMFVNAYPFWEGIPIENAVDQIFEKINEVRQRVPYKELILSETGWPEGGNNFGDSIASKQNQIKYFKEFTCRAKAEKLKYYWFSAFDESWKQTEQKMNWGVFQEGLKLKSAYPNPLISC